MTENAGNLPSVDQIKAAQVLYKKMEYWQLEDQILAEFRAKNPALTNQKMTLIKATLINSFYGTRFEKIDQITGWIINRERGLIKEYEMMGVDKNKHITFIQNMARFDKTDDQDKLDGYIVFASKFAHFFIDVAAFLSTINMQT